jgi:HEAT repeat protein
MAQDGQPEVRIKSVAGLASLGSDEARLQLRALLKNETDQLVVAQIRHLLNIPSATFASKRQ